LGTTGNLDVYIVERTGLYLTLLWPLRGCNAADFFTLTIGYYLNGHNYDIVQLLSECPALLYNEMLQNKKIKNTVVLPVGKRSNKQYSSLLLYLSLLSSRLIRQWVQAFVRCCGGARAAWG